jgi:hypothetical protein
MISWLPTLIIGQFFLVLLLAIWTLMLLLFRKHQTQRFKTLSDAYQELLTQEMLEPTAESNGFVRWKAMKFDRKVFHDVLLNQMKMVTGDERVHLLKLYEELKFKDHDLKRCKALLWPNRLRAVIHLGALDEPDLAPLFFKIIPDPAPLVSIAALLSLSKLEHPLNNPNLIDKIPKSILNRSNTLYELVANIGKHHGVDPLIKGIRNDNRPRVIDACLRARRNLRSFDSTEALNSLLVAPGMLSPFALREIIETLTQVGDPSSIKAVRPYLHHPVPSVRAKCILFLLTLQDEASQSQIEKMRSDHATEIRRIFQVYDSTLSGETK